MAITIAAGCVSRGADRQTLLTVDGWREEGRMTIGNDGSPFIVWSGDLDGDGKLDLLLNVTDHCDISLPTLYLSSAAKGGELVHEVAHFRSVGC